MGDAPAAMGATAPRPRFQPGAALELLKPVTWFPPMWAFLCGAASTGAPFAPRALMALGGVLLAGPAVCAASQAVNDWFDRDVDAINEPNRPIPSGRLPGRTGLYLAWLWTALSLALGAALGPIPLSAAGCGLVLAWAYSAPPFRLKARGWWGPLAVAISYEGLAWITGAAVIGGRTPSAPSALLAALYSLGSIGIMVLNDFKSVEGDLALGLRSVPAMLGRPRAASRACLLMAGAQVLVVATLLLDGRLWGGLAVGGLLGVQLLLMRRFLQDPTGRAVWYSAFGVGLFVLGMMASALSLGLGGVA